MFDINEMLEYMEFDMQQSIFAMYEDAVMQMQRTGRSIEEINAFTDEFDRSTSREQAEATINQWKTRVLN